MHGEGLLGGRLMSHALTRKCISEFVCPTQGLAGSLRVSRRCGGHVKRMTTELVQDICKERSMWPGAESSCKMQSAQHHFDSSGLITKLFWDGTGVC